MDLWLNLKLGSNSRKCKRRSSHPSLLSMLLLLVLIGFISVYYLSSYNSKEAVFFESSLLISSSSSSSYCNLPLDINPWDPSVLEYIKVSPSFVECPEDYSIISSNVNASGLLSLDVNEPSIQRKGYKCFVKSLLRGNNDQALVYSTERRIALGSTLDMKRDATPFVVVRCLNTKGREVYSRTHSFPCIKWANRGETKPVRGERQPFGKTSRYPSPPSIFILVVESLSRINFLRFLKQTKSALEAKQREDQSKLFTLKGLTKIASNSFPNMVAFLSGIRAYCGEIDPLFINESTGPYDNLTFMWKEYKAQGYSTAFLEDAAVGLFDYLGKGFVKQPVDWYPRPFWLHIVNREKTGNGQSVCYYDRPKVQVLFEQGKQFFDESRARGQPSFTHLFYSQLTHDDFNGVQLLDSYLSSYISSLDLGSSLFVLMGDHGNRFGPILETNVGSIESRMPLFSLLVPRHLLNEFPSLATNLMANEDKLTTWLDVHQTLLDIPFYNFSSLPAKVDKEIKRAYSLWREEVPKERTCPSALIPDNFCVCDQNKELDVNLPEVRDAALHLTYFLNERLSSHFSRCSPLYLNRTKTAHLILPSKAIVTPKGLEQTMELVIEVNPSKALFRGQVRRRAEDRGVWRLRGDFSRINRYGDQPHCLGDENKRLKPFCFCYDKESN